MTTLAELGVLLVMIGLNVTIALVCLVCSRPRPCANCRRRHRAGQRVSAR